MKIYDLIIVIVPILLCYSLLRSLMGHERSAVQSSQAAEHLSQSATRWKR